MLFLLWQLNADISHVAFLFAKQNKPLCNWDTKTQSAVSLLCLQLIWTPFLCLLHLVTDIFRLALFCVQASASLFAQAGSKQRGSRLFVPCLTVFHPIINVIFKENICWNKLAADQREPFLHKPNRLMRAPPATPTVTTLSVFLSWGKVDFKRSQWERTAAKKTPSAVLTRY